MMRRFTQKDINRWLCLLVMAGIVGFRLLVAYSQRVFLLPEGSGIDDMLMIRAAQSLTAGNWLGDYGGMTIAKNMGFAFWVALWHKLGVPIMLANAGLWLVASGFATWALRPLARGNLSRLCVFVLLVLHPITFDFFNQRVYRDAVFPAVSLLFFAGVLGLGLRLPQENKWDSVLCAVVAGVGLSGAWLVREDGAMLLAYAVCGLGLIMLCAAIGKETRKRLCKMICAVLPVCLLACSVLAFSAGNKAYYNVFMVNDLTQGEFPKAYGAVVGVAHGEAEPEAMVPVPQKALQKLYQEVPSMALLQPYLLDGTLFNGFANKGTGEYGGSFYFALKLAADYAGLTPDGTTAQQFWRDMATEIDNAVQEGRLKSVKVPSATIPLWSKGLGMPLIREIGSSAWTIIAMPGAEVRPVESIGPPDKVQAVAEYLHSPVQSGYVQGTSELYYNMVQKLCFGICDIIIWIYRVLHFVLLAYALIILMKRFLQTLYRRKSKQFYGQSMLAVVLLFGLLCSVLLRLGISSYMEVAAFGIGTSIMYLAGAVPPLLVFCIALVVWQPAQEKHHKGDTI